MAVCCQFNALLVTAIKLIPSPVLSNNIVYTPLCLSLCVLVQPKRLLRLYTEIAYNNTIDLRARTPKEVLANEFSALR